MSPTLTNFVIALSGGVISILLLSIAYFLRTVLTKLDNAVSFIASMDKSIAILSSDLKHNNFEIDALREKSREFSDAIEKLKVTDHKIKNELNVIGLGCQHHRDNIHTAISN